MNASAFPVTFPPAARAVCSRCGSADVRADAWVVWNHEAQDWDLASAHEGGGYCGECDDACFIAWREEEASDPLWDSSHRYATAASGNVYAAMPAEDTGRTALDWTEDALDRLTIGTALFGALGVAAVLIGLACLWWPL